MSKILKTPIRNFSLHNILKCQERFKISNGVKILIISVITLGLGFLTAPSARATVVDELVVEYWTGTEWIKWLSSPVSFPIFSETNFLPGEDVTRLIRVTNKSASMQRIAIEAINFTKPVPSDDLSRALDIVIGQGGSDIFGGSAGQKFLYQFYQNGETYLSDLASGAMIQYDITIFFPFDTGNEWQGKITTKTTQFDILVGFEGTEGGLVLPGPGGSGGGGLPAGLTIINEAATSTTETTATITWLTSYAATSQVIYGTASEKHTLDLTDTIGSPPKYGYEYTTSESNTSPKVTFHTVTITGLTSGTTYYFRCVSHASFAISTEHTFTTLGIKKIEEGTSIPPTVAGEEAFVYEGTGPGPAGAGEAIPEELTEGSVKGETTGETAVGQEESGMGLGKLLAAIGSFFGSENLCWLLLLLIAILLVLFLLSVAGKKQEKKKKWILPLIILILIILYSFLSCANYLWFIIIISLSVILFFIFRKRLTKPAPTEQP